jgi:dUTP pyrophosphatase
MLNHQTIRHLITNHQLITHYKDLKIQLQPTGFDLTLHHIETYKGPGTVDYTNRERTIASTTPLEPDPEGWYNLSPGAYKVVYNETVNMPLDLAAIARTRSTLLRNGAAIATAVWDPGYSGRSSSLLTVHNPHGTRLKRDARIAQLIFFHTDTVQKAYDGVYQNERNDPQPT